MPFIYCTNVTHIAAVETSADMFETDKINGDWIFALSDVSGKHLTAITELVCSSNFICTKCILHTLSILQHVSPYHTYHHQGVFVVVNITLSNGKRPYICEEWQNPKTCSPFVFVPYSLEVRVVSWASVKIFGKLRISWVCVCVCVCLCVCVCSAGENTVNWHNPTPVEVMK